MSLINIQNLNFSYPENVEPVFQDVSFQIDTNWKLGFTGRNGRGKTTFLKLLLGELDAGRAIHSTVGFDYFPHPVQDAQWMAYDVLEAIKPDLALWRLKKELKLLGLEEDILYQTYATLSGGEQTKLQLAALFASENQFLLIDEPTNHLDLAGRDLLAGYLESKAGFILISHDRALLDRCTDHTLSINRQNIEIQKGSFSVYLYNKELRENHERAENAKLAKEIDRLHQSAAEMAVWSDKVESSKIGTHVADRGHVGRMAAKMMQRSKSAERRKLRAAEEKSKLLKNIETQESVKIHPLTHHADVLAELQNVQIFAEEKIIANIPSLRLENQKVTAITGGNGSGKTSALKLIAGEIDRYKGIFKRASGLKISYVPQDIHQLHGDLKAYAKTADVNETLFLTILRKFDFDRALFDQDLQKLSDGQKKKVLLAKSLAEQAHLYIWDEPLNYLDIYSRMQLEELILDFRPTLLIVEHDRYFLENITDTLICLDVDTSAPNA